MCTETTTERGTGKDGPRVKRSPLGGFPEQIQNRLNLGGVGGNWAASSILHTARRHLAPQEWDQLVASLGITENAIDKLLKWKEFFPDQPPTLPTAKVALLVTHLPDAQECHKFLNGSFLVNNKILKGFEMGQQKMRDFLVGDFRSVTPIDEEKVAKIMSAPKKFSTKGVDLTGTSFKDKLLLFVHMNPNCTAREALQDLFPKTKQTNANYSRVYYALRRATDKRLVIKTLHDGVNYWHINEDGWETYKKGMALLKNTEPTTNEVSVAVVPNGILDDLVGRYCKQKSMSRAELIEKALTEFLLRRASF